MHLLHRIDSGSWVIRAQSPECPLRLGLCSDMSPYTFWGAFFRRVKPLYARSESYAQT